MVELFANISRSWLSAGDDATNSYAIPKFSYKENESIVSIIKRVMNTPRFTEVGNNYYTKTWVFLINQQPVGYIMHTKDKTVIKALIEAVPPINMSENLNFYFFSVLNQDLAKYLKQFGVKL